MDASSEVYYVLILVRKTQQEIRIADEIWIKVLRIHRDSVKLGIVAPDDITIIREELIQPEPSMSDKIAENVDATP